MEKKNLLKKEKSRIEELTEAFDNFEDYEKQSQTAELDYIVKSEAESKKRKIAKSFQLPENLANKLKDMSLRTNTSQNEILKLILEKFFDGKLNKNGENYNI